MAENRLEQLKNKYAPAFRVIEQQQVRLQNVNMEGDKLFIRGEAPSQDAKDKVWDQIKLVDPSYSDLIADFTVSAQAQQQASQQQEQRTMGAGAGGAQRETQETYTVRPGDSLSAIAQRYYGDASAYMRIFNANRDKLKDPNMIRPGQELVIPKE
jgi:nucleoid-associated protein YgaU